MKVKTECEAPKNETSAEQEQMLAELAKRLKLKTGIRAGGGGPVYGQSNNC
jgi:hypothetical protein